MTEFLDLHLRQFPPEGRADALLMRHELKLAEYADLSSSMPERMAAVAEANDLLELLITESPDDQRRMQWLFDLGHSLIYVQGDSDLTNILYRGGSPSDHRRMRRLTERAVNALTRLTALISTEYDRIDELPVRAFERLERHGYIDTLDELAPRGEYLLLWALLYDATVRHDEDPARALALNKIVASLADNPSPFDIPHEQSQIQVQTLLLAGMTHRLLNDHAAARQFLDRAALVADRLTDEAQRLRIDWAVTLAHIEGVRNDRDEGRYDQSLRRIDRMRRVASSDVDKRFGQLLVAALLERSVYKAHVDAVRRDGDMAAVQQLSQRSWQSLSLLTREHLDQRDEIYAAVYQLIGPDADPQSLDPFELCSLVAGLLFDADEIDRGSAAWLQRCIAAGEIFLAGTDSLAESLVPDVLHNMGAAQYRLGHSLQAADAFKKLARDYPSFDKSKRSAVYAVQLVSALYEDRSDADKIALRPVYLEALETLLQGCAECKEAKYWRFCYAQLLEEKGSLDAAAGQYALIEPEHQHYLHARVATLRCLSRGLAQLTETARTDVSEVRRLSKAFFESSGGVMTLLSKRLEESGEPAQSSSIRALLARAALLDAEVKILQPVDRTSEALADLAEFETHFPAASHLIGRVWRVRLVAYERLGRLEEAALAIPAYMAAAPGQAGPVLESLYRNLAGQVERLKQEGREDSAGRKADLALLLARQVLDWAMSDPNRVDAGRLRSIRLQLAEANASAGEYQQAKELFEQCGVCDDPSTPDAEIDARVESGYAEALYRLGLMAEALPRFNQLARRIPDTSPLRWNALLRDLQCRTALGHKAAGIINVIEQQRYLNPEMGGPHLAAEFEKLLRENHRRPSDG